MKIIRTALLLSAIALLIPTPARAEWIYINSNQDWQVDVESDSIKYKGADVFFIERTLYEFPDSRGVQAEVNFASINCNSGMFSSYRLVGLDKTKNVVFDEGGNVLRVRASPIGSFGNDVYEFLCR